MVVAVVATLTLIPAILSLLGDKIDWPRRRKYDAATAASAGRVRPRDDPHAASGAGSPGRDGPPGRQRRRSPSGLLVALRAARTST